MSIEISDCRKCGNHDHLLIRNRTALMVSGEWSPSVSVECYCCMSSTHVTDSVEVAVDEWNRMNGE